MKLLNTTYLSLLLTLVISCAQAQWVRQGTSRVFSRSNAVATDPSGNVYSAGTFICIMALGGTELLNNSCGEVVPPAPSEPRTDGFLAKHDENGDLLWVIQFTGSEGNTLLLNDVTVDVAGNAYVTGAYTGSLDLITSSHNNPDPTTEYFLVKVRPDGTPEWAQSDAVDDLSETSAQRIAATADAVYITGSVRGEFSIGASSDSVGREASFIASFDLAGVPLWTKNFMEINANGSSRGKALEAQGDSVWVFSSFTDTVNVEGNMVAPLGLGGPTTGGIICLYDASGTLQNRILTNTPLIEGIKLHRPDASLYITGRAENVTAIGGDTLFNTPGIRAYVSSHSLDPDPDLQWVTPITTTTSTTLTGVDIDVSASGNIYAAGIFNSATISAPATTAPGGGGQNGFLLKLDAGGNDLWLQSFGGTGENALAGISAREDTRVFGAGYFAQYLRIAGNELYSNAVNNAFVARIDICPELIADMISPDSTYICTRDAAVFQVTDDATYTYRWYHDGNPVAGAGSADLEVSEEGIYRAEVSNGGCAKFTPVARLFLYPLPDSVVLTNDPMNNCAGDAVNLAGPIGSYTFQWLDDGSPIGETSKDLVVQADGDYQLEVTDTLGCSILSDVFPVRFHPYPPATLTPPAARHTLCSGNSYLLAADNSQSGMSWQWKKDDLPITGENDFQLEVTTSGIYHAVISNAVGCETITEADTVVVQQSPLVNLNDEVLPPEICDGSSLRLITPQVIGQTYQWFRNGAAIVGANDFSFDASQTGTYTVRVSNSLCQKLSDAFTLVVNPLPDAVITNNAQASVCSGDAYALQAQAAANYSYEWFYNGILLGGEDQSSLDVTQTGNYSLRVTNEFSCQKMSPATSVIVNPRPPAFITVTGDLVFCEGDDVLLSANAGPSFSYEWLRDGVDVGGGTLRTLQVSESGSFQVRVTNTNLCAETSPPVVVQAVPYPVSTINSHDGLRAICEGDSLQLIAEAQGISYKYEWLHNAWPVNNATENTFYAKAGGNYQVITSSGSCRDTSSVLTLHVRSNPVPVITRNEAFLSVPSFGRIQWFRNGVEITAGINLQSIQVSDDGEYAVSVLNADGCTARSEVVPVCLPIPEVQRTNDLLFVSIPAQQYAWKYGQMPIVGGRQRQLTAQQSGEYSAVVVGNDGCVMETAPVTVCVPYPYITADDITGALYAFPHPAVSYQWYYEGELVPDGKTQVHIPDGSGAYTVEVADLDGCVSTSESYSISPVTGIETNDGPVHFYPNPAKDILIVERLGTERILLTIVDAIGRRVRELYIENTIQQIALADLAPGSYTIVASTQDQKVTWKLIRQ